MKTVFREKTECSGCGACLNVCPRNCIAMKRDDEGFVYPEIDQTLCIDCHKCQKLCPFQQEVVKAIIKECYAAYNKNLATRMKSSSGAIFSALALSVLNEKGVVYGGAFTEDFKKVKIQVAENPEQLESLYGSKYLQSDTGTSFQEVKKYLTEGRTVLFSGTPCQVAGLKYSLGKKYDNLFCVDIICHGTPSPALWEKYTLHLENQYGGKISSVNFRCKDSNWSDFGMKEKVSDRWIYTSKTDNPYMLMFLKNYCLRPSCYACKMKGHSVADITIGDFWGVDEIHPELNDGKGISSVIVRTRKGQRLLKNISEDIVAKQCTYDEIIRKNSAEVNSVLAPAERKTFFLDMNKLSFSQLKNKYVGNRCKQKLKKMLRILRGGGTARATNYDYGILIGIKKQ